MHEPRAARSLASRLRCVETHWESGPNHVHGAQRIVNPFDKLKAALVQKFCTSRYHT